MGLIVITGLSGAGKTLASNTLEDIGYNCIDNLPPSLLLAVSRVSDVDKLAIVADCRFREGEPSLLEELEKLKQNNVEYKMLFLDCEKDVLLGRYKYTRRPHPLNSDRYPTLEQAIDHEIELSREIRDKADYVVDTTHLNANQFKNMLTDTFKHADYHGLTVKIVSFGFKNGLPADADLIYDVRCLPNPYYIPGLKNLSGFDAPVSDYVFSFEQSVKVLQMMKEYITYCLPYFTEEGKKELVVGIGCTSGHHRSVCFARKLAEELSGLSNNVIVVHRDIEREYDHD